MAAQTRAIPRLPTTSSPERNNLLVTVVGQLLVTRPSGKSVRTKGTSDKVSVRDHVRYVRYQSIATRTIAKRAPYFNADRIKCRAGRLSSDSSMKNPAITGLYPQRAADDTRRLLLRINTADCRKIRLEFCSKNLQHVARCPKNTKPHSCNIGSCPFHPISRDSKTGSCRLLRVS